MYRKWLPIKCIAYCVTFVPHVEDHIGQGSGGVACSAHLPNTQNKHSVRAPEGPIDGTTILNFYTKDQFLSTGMKKLHGCQRINEASSVKQSRQIFHKTKL